MKLKTQPSSSKYSTDAWINARAAEIRAQMEADSPSPDDHKGDPDGIAAQLDNPVVVSGQVSTYMEADPGRGSFAIQLAVDDATITTCVTLEQCSALSLRCAAFRIAKQFLGSLLAQVRASQQVSDKHYFAPKKRSKSKSAAPKPPEVQRDSFWVSQVRTDGAPDFESTAWNMTHSLKCSAALAELAFHEIE